MNLCSLKDTVGREWNSSQRLGKGTCDTCTTYSYFAYLYKAYKLMWGRHYGEKMGKWHKEILYKRRSPDGLYTHEKVR